MTTSDLHARLRNALAGRADLAAAWLFGSRARGTEREGSDVDLAVLFCDDPPPTLEGLMLNLQDDLAGELGRAVDLVVMNRAPADLVHRVLRDGELLVENDRSRRVRFEVARRAEYFDLLPILRRYRRVEAAP
jgi:predicted nucleotidyltransferase